MRVFQLVPALLLMNAIQPHALAQSLPESAGLSSAGSGAKAATVKQAIIINLALKDGQFYLGEIPSQITDERVEAIERESLLKLAAPLLKEAMMQTVRKLPAQAGFVQLKKLKEAGFPFEFDIGQMTLSFFPTAEQRPSSHISLSQNGDEASDEQLAPRPAVQRLYQSERQRAVYGGERPLAARYAFTRGERVRRIVLSTWSSKAKPVSATQEN